MSKLAPNMLKQGFILVEDFPDYLKHKNLNHYFLDEVLLVEIREYENSYYVHKKNLEDLKYVLNNKSCAMVRISERKAWIGIQDFSIF